MMLINFWQTIMIIYSNKNGFKILIKKIIELWKLIIFSGNLLIIHKIIYYNRIWKNKCRITLS